MTLDRHTRWRSNWTRPHRGRAPGSPTCSGGRAWVEDRDGGGASFRVYLPFASASDEPLEDLQPDGTLVPATTTRSEAG